MLISSEALKPHWHLFQRFASRSHNLKRDVGQMFGGTTAQAAHLEIKRRVALWLYLWIIRVWSKQAIPKVSQVAQSLESKAWVGRYWGSPIFINFLDQWHPLARSMASSPFWNVCKETVVSFWTSPLPLMRLASNRCCCSGDEMGEMAWWARMTWSAKPLKLTFGHISMDLARED